jgi:hypothetical protein
MQLVRKLGIGLALVVGMTAQGRAQSDGDLLFAANVTARYAANASACGQAQSGTDATLKMASAIDRRYGKVAVNDWLARFKAELDRAAGATCDRAAVSKWQALFEQAYDRMKK